MSQPFTAYVATPKSLYVWSHSLNQKINGVSAWIDLTTNVNGSFDNLI
jgi:hypothetical protein